jgi:hypothetical protein
VLLRLLLRRRLVLVARNGKEPFGEDIAVNRRCERGEFFAEVGSREQGRP